jgi:hypothetical protein
MGKNVGRESAFHPGNSGFQVYRRLEKGHHFKTGLADGEIDHLMVNLKLKVESPIVEDLATVGATGVILQGGSAERELHHGSFSSTVEYRVQEFEGS